MITYTYIVKCPECDDEFFDFFDEAKDFAMGCLTKKPMITQTEVNRNVFGECTDHCDLGTVWSWEDMMKDTEPEDMVFSKDETFGISEGLDDFDDFDIGPQIDEFDNSLDFEIEDDTTETLWVAENLNGGEIVAACWADSEDLAHRLLSQAFRERTGGDLRDCYIREAEADEPDYITDNPNLLAEACERKPIPEGMTIEQLVEAMEENEDTVECAGCQELFPKEECTHKDGYGWLCDDCEDNVVKCTWCEDLYDKYECDFEYDMGWLCDRCQSAITSRGERLSIITNPTEEDFARVMNEEVEPENVHDLGNTYDGGYPEDTELVEAFKYLPLVPDAKEQIVAELKQIPNIARYIKNDTIAVDLYVKANNASKYSNAGKVVDFIITGENIEICFEKNGRRLFVELEAALQGTDLWFGQLYRTMPTYQVLKALNTAATKINRANIDVTGIRDHKAIVTLTPEIADELKTHIRDIRFKIPRDNNYSGSELLDAEPHPKDTFLASNPDVEKLDKAADQVAEHLSNIHNSFMSLPFAKDAVAAGMVSYRDPIDLDGCLVDTFKRFKEKWGIACTIYFEKGWTIDNFSEATKKYLENMKIESKQNNKAELDDKTETADIDTANKSKSKAEPKIPNSVNGIRTAKALIRYFNNNVRFFEKTSKITEASLRDILSNVNDEYGTDYTERGFIDSEGLEDEAFFLDFDPAEPGKELYAKRGLNAFGGKRGHR